MFISKLAWILVKRSIFVGIMLRIISKFAWILVKRSIFVGIMLRIIGGFKRISGKSNWKI